MKSVGAYEAKTHLPQLLEEVARGERITITKHGVPVAVLVQPGIGPLSDRRDAIRQMREFSQGRRLGGETIGQMIAEGRK